MGVFTPPVPDIVIAPINMISSIGTHLGDPWVISNPSEVESYGDAILLSLTKLSYFLIQSETVSDVCFSQEDKLNQYSLPKWEEIHSSPSHDFLSEPLLFDKAIIETMMTSEIPWEDHHRQSSILPTLSE